MSAFDGLPRGHMVAGRYRIETPIGRGRSAVVYRAIDCQTETPVALKILDPVVAADPLAAERFLREAQILRALDHPNVVKVYDFIRDGSWSIICMEWVDGLDGRAYLERYGRMSIADFLRIAKTMAAVLDACHRLKVVHRDLKPQNLLIGSRGDLKVADFGISKMSTMADLTRTGTAFGTPQYMAPELFQSARADPRSDIYALGAVFYELLAGRPAYAATTIGTLMTQQMRGEVEPFSSSRDDVPSWLSAIVFKCLHIDPAQRYQSCYELQRDLEQQERARAGYEQSAPAVACLVCQAALLAGLPFCIQCGAGRDLPVERGPCCVTLLRNDAPEALRSYLAAQFPHAATAELSKRLSRLPVVLFQGISRETTKRLMHQLSVFPCEVRISGHVATALRIPALRSVLGMVLLAPLFWLAESLPAWGRAAMILAAEGLIVAAYRWQARPVISVTALRRPPRAADDPTLSAIAQRLRGVSDANLRMILAQVARSYLQVNDGLRRSTSFIRLEAVQRVVLAAFDAAKLIEKQEAYLAGTTETDWRHRLHAVDAQLERKRNAPDTTALIEHKTRLRRDLQNFHELQDCFSTLYLGLFHLHTLLQRLADHLRDTKTEAAILAELRGLEADFEAQVRAEQETHGDRNTARAAS